MQNKDTNKTQETSNIPKLQYVECPNCKSSFDNKEKYADWKTFIGINKFLCKNCKIEFKYPSNKKYWLDLIIGIILLVGSADVPITPGDILKIAFLSCLGIAGILLTLQGIFGLIENSSLKSKNPEWENRFHNTRYSK